MPTHGALDGSTIGIVMRQHCGCEQGVRVCFWHKAAGLGGPERRQLSGVEQTMFEKAETGRF